MNARFGHEEWTLAYAVALRILKAPDQAEDAAQEAMLRAFRFRDRFRGTARFESWLHRIAYTAAIGELRRPHVRRHGGGNDLMDTLPAPTLSPEELMGGAELGEKLAVCLADLSDADRTAFVERYLLGTTERELGEMLGVSTNAAKQRAFRARRSVRRSIGATSMQARR